jgi:hypothetical protein
MHLKTIQKQFKEDMKAFMSRYLRADKEHKEQEQLLI